eukprot:CAMPEP_0184860828 /NCGR_PEP_ID=MMETSP0580-20130426/5634_1 /TAXON_ID=1118495 /ORGANISM="Dactyliosolen fragilissimus" /LENGTH=553 /DNA_ID=CAMNT_0027358081 /DNA_START=300 /DNA_END=1961 /DNA_ORIENTATION=-
MNNTPKKDEAAAKRAEYDAYTQQQRASNIEREGEEARKTLEAQSQHKRSQADYADELERKRQVDMLQAQKYMQEEQLKKQEEMVARQEAMRRKTAEHEAELRTKTELAKVAAEAEGKIRQERANHDLILEKVRLEALEKRDTVLRALKDGGKMVGEGLGSYLDDREKLRNTALMLTAVAGGVYATRTTAGVMGRFVEARLGKPSLVRETSRLSVGSFVKHPVQSASRFFGLGKYGGKTPEEAMRGIVLEQNLDSQLRRIAVSTAHTKKNRAPFRHLLLHGPPGTGKTLFARSLAAHSGLDFAVFTGGDVAPLGRDAVTELHKLFEWAKTSRRGLLLFVDEADAFLQSRDGGNAGGDGNAVVSRVNNTMSEDQRNALNAFLYRTGTESDQFMMVYASNQPSQFDEAILDRIDEMVEFDLPGTHERKKMIAMFIDKYLLHPPGRWTKKVQTVDIGEEEIDRVVKMTEGFSGRAIAKLAISWQAAAYGTDGAILDQETFFRTVEHQKRSMETKDAWMHGAKQQADVLTTDRSSLIFIIMNIIIDIINVIIIILQEN